MQKPNRIELLERVKGSLINNEYNSGDDLQNDIDNIIDLFWAKDRLLINENLYEIDLSEFNKFHEYLIEKVIDIHKNENCSKNAEILKHSTRFNTSLEKISDAKSAHKIYMFNKSYDYVYVGDLHSDDYSLRRALQFAKFYGKVISDKNTRLIFTGDYVDRGNVHLKIMERILILKYLFPEYIFLLRGNHDGGIVNEDGSLTVPYGIPKKDSLEMYFPHYLQTLSRRNKSFNSSLLEMYLDLFNSLSYMAAIKNKNQTVLAVHGGIPRPKYKSSIYYKHLNVIADLTDESNTDHIGRNICQNIMWSDPYRGEGEIRELTGRYHFTQEHYNEFREKYGFDLLVRGHESALDGFRYHFDDSLITIFSTGAKCVTNNKLGSNDTLNTESAYMDVTPKVLSISYDGTLTFL